MPLTNNNYKNRLVDEKIKEYLEVFGAISIEGPKWCGKTWTALNHANSVVYMDEEENQEAYTENYRSRERIGKVSKRHYTDPSLACSLLDLNSDKLLNDLNTFGLMFESLVERDLRIYMEYLHFRDNVTGLEVDSILEFNGDDYAAVEIKLESNKIEEAIQNLKKFYDSMIKKPKFMCVIVGKGNAIMYSEIHILYLLQH